MKIPYKMTKDANEAYKKVEALLQGDLLSKMKVDAKLNCDPGAKRIKAEGKGFTLTAEFKDSGCEVDLDLSFMLKPLKGTILAKVEDQFKRAL